MVAGFEQAGHEWPARSDSDKLSAAIQDPSLCVRGTSQGPEAQDRASHQQKESHIVIAIDAWSPAQSGLRVSSLTGSQVAESVFPTLRGMNQ